MPWWSSALTPALSTPALLVAVQLADAIGDAIRDADLNLNPQVEGSLVRVPIPKSSKETKEATVKLISKIAESGKNRVRRVRQAAMEKLKKTEGACVVSRGANSGASRLREARAAACHRRFPTDSVGARNTHPDPACRGQHGRHFSRHQGRQCAGFHRH